MIIPGFTIAAHTAIPTSSASATATATVSPSPGSGFTGNGDWSSLIGIVTAIVGNILISFALNTQRYAHIRLARELEEREKQRRLGKGRRGDGYGRQQAYLADARAKANLRSGGYHGIVDGHQNGADPHGDEEGATESDPLLRRSSDSQSTIRPKDDEESFRKKSYLKSPYWWAGIIMMTTGEAGNFLAYGFAPASIVSPLGVVALISNCIIAPFMLKEPFRKRDFLGVVVSVAGAVTVVLSASDNNPKLGPSEIWDLISRWEFETYLGITVATIIVLMWASAEYGEKSIFIDLGLVGLFGGYTALSTKGVASLLSYTLWRAITFPVSYLLVAILIFTAVMQIKYINRALQRFDATQVIPTQFVMFTLSVILGSAILYRDFEKESTSDAGKFMGGCAMTFLGVWLITTGRPPQGGDLDERSPEEEDAINLADEGDVEVDDFIAPQPSTAALVTPAPALYHVPGTNSYQQLPQEHAETPPSSQPRHPAATPSITFTTPAASSNASTVSSFESPSSLLDNPWQRSATDLHAPGTPSPMGLPNRSNSQPLPSHPPLTSTASDPILPPESQVLPPRPLTPRSTSPIPPPRTPITPATPRDQTYHTPPTHPKTRASIADIIAGPLSTPLSGGLTAVIADSLRRGVDLHGITGPPSERVPRRRGSLRRRPTVPDPTGDNAGEGVASGDNSQRQRTGSDGDVLAAFAGGVRDAGVGDGAVGSGEQTGHDRQSAQEQGGRARSWSATFGGLLRRASSVRDER